MEAVSSQHWQQQQRQLNGKKVFIHMWLWTCCPFKELGGRQRTASRRGSVKRYGFLSNVRDRGCCDEHTDRQCVHRRRSVPFPCSLSCEGLDSWAYALCQMVSSFLIAKSDSFFFSVRVVTACRSWQPDLACLVPVSRSTDHIVDSFTHDLLAGFTLVDLLTLAKKNWDSHASMQNYRRVHGRESTRLA